MGNLRRRIVNVGQNMVSASPVAAGVVPATPMTMPLALITYSPVQNYPGGAANGPWGGSVDLAYQDLQPLWTADGGYIPAKSNSGWGWVKPVPAGRV
jgi:hypothetical protein